MRNHLVRLLAPLSLLTLLAAESAPTADVPKETPRESPLGSPQGIPLGSPPGSPLASPQGSPKETPKDSIVQTVQPSQAEAILGRRVADSAGKDIGRLVDVLVDASGTPQAAVIDFGGFMGVGNRRIAVHWSTLQFSPGAQKHKITLSMTPDQIKAAPEYVDTSKPAPVVTPTDVAPVAR